MTDEQKDEFEYLKWFRCNADFGPGEGDVIFYMHKRYEEKTGKKVPPGWSEED